MVQTFDFMSENYKHVLIQKVTQAYTRKFCINRQKPVCAPVNVVLRHQIP